ncbi:zinc ribbon domain-containing protein [Niveibacterium terrae]|uniref:zinc ribbon domain-containing protein n=1 Tax=Niveibacterium terrae TaxID=3373598 RepID=UPI003A8DC867
MPLYDFHCPVCDRIFELLVSQSSAPGCPVCAGALTRQIARPSLAGKSAKLIARARAQAGREGHFSHYPASERAKLKT